MPRASLSKLLYLFSALVRLLVLNVMGLSMLLSGTSSMWQLVLLLVCSRVAPSPTLNTSISMCSSLAL